MNCLKCKEQAVFLEPTLCKKHFINYFEKKVKKTIKDFKLLKKTDKVVVACSGGKDSTSVLYLLKKFHGKVEALAIDEGIKGYRDQTLIDLKKFCSENNVKLHVYSFKDSFGKTLNVMLKKKNHPCTVCGTLRRYLLNKYANKYDKIATGHNMDDESQAILMNLTKANTDLLLHSTPITPKTKGFVQRIKPLYFCLEKEVAAYSLLKEFDVGFTECPYVSQAYRNDIREELNKYTQKHKGTKLNILNKHLSIIKKIQVKKIGFKHCKKCGEPSKEDVCKTCQIIQNFK